MIPRHPSSTRTDTPLPYPTLFRSLDWPYHPHYDRTHWFDARTCARPAAAGWSDKYHGGGGALPPPPFDLFKTPEYLDQVGRCHQAACRAAGRCQGNEARAAVTWVGKKAAGRLLDGRSDAHTSELQPLMRNSYAVF